jgi:hypothetical protein
LIDSISYIVFFFPELLILASSAARSGLRLPDQRDSTRRRGGRSCGRSRRGAARLPAADDPGILGVLKSFYMARTGIELEHKEKVEV